MQTRQLAVLLLPVIGYWVAACGRDVPTEARPGRIATDAISTDLSQSYQVILSCTDGHSVVLSVDAATLTSLAADVDAINASGTGVTCTLDSTALDPSSQTAAWTVYDYNPSNNALAPRNAPNKMPATTTSDGTTTFEFLPGMYTALLTTTDRSLTGDLHMTTLTDKITVSGNATTFVTQHGGGDCVGDVPAAVRFYFVSPSASGSTIGTPPAGFYTQFWWSNRASLQLLNGTQSATIIANVGDVTEWSDWNGKRPSDSPEVAAAFDKAIHNVQTVGLSFGGLCFFETGVTAEYPPNTAPDEMFSSTFSETPTP
jgi:hypothetical protein